MTGRTACGVVIVLVLAVMALVAGSAQAKVHGPNGQIAFQRFDSSTRNFAVYRVNPNGSHLQLVFDNGADGPHWSPSGAEVSFFCCDDGMIAHIFNVDTGVFREIAPLADPPDLTAACGRLMAAGSPA